MLVGRELEGEIRDKLYIAILGTINNVVFSKNDIFNERLLADFAEFSVSGLVASSKILINPQHKGTYIILMVNSNKDKCKWMKLNFIIAEDISIDYVKLTSYMICDKVISSMVANRMGILEENYEETVSYL